MAIHNFEPRRHTTRNNTVWQIVDVRLKRRVSDGHFTIEANGDPDTPGVFGTAASTERALQQLARILTRLESAQLNLTPHPTNLP